MPQHPKDDEPVRSRTADGRAVTIHGLAGPVADEDLIESVAQPRVPPIEEDPNREAVRRTLNAGG